MVKNSTLDMRDFSPETVLKGLRNINELRFLHVFLENNNAESERERYRRNWKFYEFPNALRYLTWMSYPFRSLPKPFQADNLVALEMPYSNIIQLWEGGERKVLNKLKFLNLSFSKLRTLELGSASNLEILNLRGCEFLIELHMPARSPNIRSLNVSKSKLRNLDLGPTPNLEHLDLSCCYDLEKLHMANECQKLTFVDISYSKLTNLDLRSTSNIKTLSMPYTETKDLPDSICMPKHFESLELYTCSSLGKSPNDIGRLECLEKLSLRSLKIKDLPDSICNLKHLHTLELDDCALLEKLPEDLGQLECLENLNLSFCKFLRDIPDSICKMKHLKHLNLDYCIQLKKLPNDLGSLGCLKELTLRGTCINHLPQSIFLLEGLRIVAPRGFLESCGFTSNVQTSNNETFCYVKGQDVTTMI